MKNFRHSNESQRIIVLLKEHLTISKSWDAKKELLIQYANHLVNILNQRERVIPFDESLNNSNHFSINIQQDTISNLLYQQNSQLNQFCQKINCVITEFHSMYQNIIKINQQLYNIDHYQNSHPDPNFNMIHTVSFQAKECADWLNTLCTQFYIKYLKQIQMAKLKFNDPKHALNFENLYDEFQYEFGIQIRKEIEQTIQDRLNLRMKMNKFLQDR